MNFEKERERFEEWLKTTPYEHTYHHGECVDLKGNYYDPAVQFMWLGYKARVEARGHMEDILHMVPSGFKLVPVEPTLTMQQAALKYVMRQRHTRDVYAAMLAVAPQPDHIAQTEPIAWLRPDDPMLAITKTQRDGALKDGGAIAKAVSAFTIPAYTHPRPDHVAQDRNMVPGAERKRFEYWAKEIMGMDITPNDSCGDVSKKTLGAWYAWGAEDRCRKRIDEAMRGEE